MNAPRAAAAFGALACAVALVLAALALHRFDGHAREQVAIAAAMAFAHGLALVAIVARTGRAAALARLAFVLGIVLFPGSLVAAATLGLPTVLAPAGGMVLMAGWAILAAGFLRPD